MDIFKIVNIILITACAYEAYKYIKKIKRSRERKRIWVREVNINRNIDGFFERSFNIIKNRDPQQFSRATRMSGEVFEMLFNLLEARLTKNSIRKPISAKCRLFLTLV